MSTASNARLAGLAALVAAAYMVAGKVGLSLASVHPSATAVWAPTGIAVAAVLLLGPRVWPAIALGAFVVNLSTTGDTPTSLGIAAGNTLEALAAGWLVGRLANGARCLERGRDTLAFAALGGLAAPLVSATLGVASLVLGGLAAPSTAPAVWLTWWVGDAVGALVVAPLILAFAAHPGASAARGAAAELAALGVATVAVGLVVFRGAVAAEFPLQFLALPLVIGAAYRLGPRGASGVTALLAAVATAATLEGLGPFALGDRGASLLVLQTFMGVVATTGLVLGAVVAERARDEAALRAAQAGMIRVEEHAASLRGALDALRRSEAQLAHAQRLAGLGSWEWDVATDRVTWSDELHRIYGLRPGEFAASFEAYLARVHPEDRERTREAIEGALAACAPFTLDERIVRPGGEVRELHSAGEVVLDEAGRPLRMVGVCRDVTELRRAEAARREAWEREQENRRLQEVNRVKSEFINAAAHELNTPLTPIKLQLHLLEGSDLPPGPQRKAAEVLRRNVDRMALLVQDMLDVARLQSGRLQLRREPVDLGELAHEAAATFGALAKARGVALRAEAGGGLAVEADGKRLTQVLHNLVSNALRFTPPGGTVRIVAARAGGEAVVRVEDTGVGLTGEQRTRLFEPFTQVHDGPVAAGGTGLGLYISRGIVEQHGGRIWAESDGSGKGSAFAFALPLAAAPEGAPRR